MRVINSVLGDARGGRWQVVCDYSRLLGALGHRVTLVLRPPLPAALPDGAGILTSRSHGHYDWPAAWRLARPLRQARLDLAIAHCSRSVALLRRALPATVPVIAVTHSLRYRRLLKADAILALGPVLGQAIRRDPAAAGKPVHVLPNFVPMPARGSHPGRNDPPVIGALGRFDPVKGLDLFIDALGQLKASGVRFRARLAGDGPQAAGLKARARALGLENRIDFPGWLDAAGVGAFLSGLDLLCVPARSDAFGLTPLQGAAAGVPLVLSRAAGHRAMFTEAGEATFFDIDDAGALAEALAALLHDPVRARAQAEAARARTAREYSEPAVRRALQRVLAAPLDPS
ncbi:MAG TPA: glycosyltransferase [Gammaproteobacteria bacterium]|nr:glycosyltransferase [Gammaproteobacteria bacterium]